MKLVIDGRVFETNQVEKGSLPQIFTTCGRSYYLAEDAEQAGEAAREYWADLIENDPKEVIACLGEDTLIDWALGRWAANAYSLIEWLDNWRDSPAEQWAAWDDEECVVTKPSKCLVQALGFTPTVAYRT